MEANKENVRQTVKTKIPVPVDPLPALPKHLFNENVENCNNEKRDPLKTLAQANVFPCSSKCKQEKLITKTKFKINIDTKHVTIRKKTESLDWDYNVLKDHDEGVNSFINDENEDKKCKGDTYFDGNKQMNSLIERLAITPDKLPIQHKSVRNIKKSLKRPHSRELQGLSPACKQEMNEENKAKRRLEFHESLQERLRSPDYWKRSYMTCMNRDYTDYMLNYLLKVERKPLAIPAITRITRACIINWLMKVNGPFGNPAVVQSACWYLDSVLSTGTIQLDKLQVVAAACYWIAQKLHGSAVSAARLLKNANHAFSKARLLAAEKTVLIKLGFPLQPVIPNEFITYLAWWCDSSHPGEIEVAATFLCMSGLMVDKELCKEYPSVIACAAVKNTVLLLKKKNMMKHLQHCPMYKATENKTSEAILSHTCIVLRRAVRTVADGIYEYKAPLENYGGAPNYIAQQIIHALRQ